MSSSQEVNLQLRVMSRDSQAGMWGRGQAEDRLGCWPTGRAGSLGPMARPGKAAGSWKLTACSVTGTGTDSPGLSWRGILGHEQGGGKPWGAGQGLGNHGGSVSGKAVN